MEGMLTGAVCNINELKTSCEWQSILNVRVTRPDGWDITNFQYSWFEEVISIGEFLGRLEGSVFTRIIEGRFDVQDGICFGVTGELCGVYEKGV